MLNHNKHHFATRWNFVSDTIKKDFKEHTCSNYEPSRDGIDAADNSLADFGISFPEWLLSN